MTTTLDPKSDYVTLINTFTVDPGRADELIAVLKRASETVFRAAPGFVSANLHVSVDRKHVANYAQWRSEEDIAASGKDPDVSAHMREAAGIATSFDPIYYHLRESIEASE